jgi:hypothetical protein
MAKITFTKEELDQYFNEQIDYQIEDLTSLNELSEPKE